MHDNDETIIKGESADGALSAHYRKHSQETPPPALDRAIKAAAASAVASPADADLSADDGSSGWSPKHRWHRPFALAAVLVLCVSLAISVQREFDEQASMVTMPSEAAPPEIDASLPEPEQPRKDAAPTQRQTLPADVAGDDSIATSADIAPAQDMPVAPERRERVAKPTSQTAEPENIQVTGQRVARDLVDAPTEPSAPTDAVEQAEASQDRQSYARSANVQGLSMTPSVFAKNEADLSPQQHLDLINALWNAGDEAGALKELGVFRERFADYDEQRLREALPSELLEQPPTPDIE